MKTTTVKEYVDMITAYGKSVEERTILYSMLCGLVDAVRQQDRAQGGATMEVKGKEE